MENPLQCDVIVSDRARQMLGTHIKFLANISIPSPKKVQTDLIEAISSLSTMPGRFPFLASEYLPLNKYHKMFVRKYYLVLYQIKDNMVYVDYIVDCRQDYQWLL